MGQFPYKLNKKQSRMERGDFLYGTQSGFSLLVLPAAASAYGIVELGVDSSFWWSTPLMRTAELAVEEEEEHQITLVILLEIRPEKWKIAKFTKMINSPNSKNQI